MAARPARAKREQAFAAKLRGINRPTTIRFGPDGAAYLVDYGAVRDPGNSDPDSKVLDPADLPLVQFPGTGVIWKITRIGGGGGHDDDDHDHDDTTTTTTSRLSAGAS